MEGVSKWVPGSDSPVSRVAPSWPPPRFCLPRRRGWGWVGWCWASQTPASLPGMRLPGASLPPHPTLRAPEGGPGTHAAPEAPGASGSRPVCELHRPRQARTSHPCPGADSPGGPRAQPVLVLCALAAWWPHLGGSLEVCSRAKPPPPETLLGRGTSWNPPCMGPTPWGQRTLLSLPVADSEHKGGGDTRR